LLGVVAAESLEVNDQNWRSVIKLDLLHGLLVLIALVAVPRVCLAQILRLVELSKAVVNTDLLLVFLLFITHKSTVLEVEVPIQVGVERPAALRIELHYQLKLR
jgi:hypothetical protein